MNPPDIDVLKKFLTLVQIARLLNTHPSTPARWIKKGVRHSTGTLFLRGIRKPGEWLVREDWLDEFLSRVTAAQGLDDSQDTQKGIIRSPVTRRRSHDEAEKELARAGF
jgi:hypothetical protein